MSAMRELELAHWAKDNTITLTYWDNMHGNDVTITFFPDGRTLGGFFDEDDETNLEPVNLFETLKALTERDDD